MKNIMGISAITFSILFILLSSCRVSLGAPVREDKEFTISNIAKISINLNIGNVSVGVSPDEKTHITYYNLL